MIESLNVRGKYVPFDEEGNPISYAVGDIVTYNKKTYLAYQAPLSHPYTEDSGWYMIGRGVSFFNQSNKPKFAKEGDKWFDKTAGTLYTMIIQTNGYYNWVEL